MLHLVPMQINSMKFGLPTLILIFYVSQTMVNAAIPPDWRSEYQDLTREADSEHLQALRANNFSVKGLKPSFLRRNTRSVVRPRDWLWHERQVPVQLDRTISPLVRKAFTEAMRDIEEKSCVEFVQRTRHNDYIRVTSLDGCWSDVGRVGGLQYLSADYYCNTKGVAIHELLHALGFWHEHSRLDRDENVQIMWENIEDDMQYNFEKHGWLYNDLLDLPYDFRSVMHYNNMAFSSNGHETIIAEDDVKNEMGQREGLSELDVKKLNKLYSCDVESGWSKWGDWSPCSVSCFRFRERFCVDGGARGQCEGETQKFEACPDTCHPGKPLGCWAYNPSSPSIPSLEGMSSLLSENHVTRRNPVRDCGNAAGELGYKVFALTDDSLCLSGPDAHLNYMDDGPSDKCTHIHRGSTTSLYAYTLEYDKLVNGEWSVWSGWSSCSETCGEGVMSRERTCTNPEPEKDALDCDGEASQSKSCLGKRCRGKSAERPISGHFRRQN